MRLIRLAQPLVITALVACSGSSEPDPSCTAPPPVSSVALADFAFEPTCIGATQGATLALRNTGVAPHTLTIESAGIDVDLAAGSSGELSLTGIEPATYAVTCRYHPQMTATLVVG